MRECKRLIKEFDGVLKDEEGKVPADVHKQLNDKKQFMIKELNSYVTLRKTYQSSLGNKRVELFEGAGPSEPAPEDHAQLASEMSNQELVDAGRKKMDETDQAIERSKQVVEQTIEVGTQTAANLKGQTEQMGRIVNELDTINFSIKKASQMVKEIGRQVATDKCIMGLLALIVCGVIAIIIVKIVNPHNKSIRDIPGLAPPAQTNRRLLSTKSRAFWCWLYLPLYLMILYACKFVSFSYDIFLSSFRLPDLWFVTAMALTLEFETLVSSENGGKK
ncbi:hypothetical protein LUZ62_073462 [Rhynchospora pubera]|uniref:t-SNARE coiled-coil homology domain-containing protein n=1 Tax=Rhynchospora pubera TaxID=906938 RepID=A0AAV8D3S7_9POAL|nr:hypothetical protein LUZ62_073462 [Rhynchospora pubera]